MGKDFFGNPLKVGDTVAFMRTKYRSLDLGIIKQISEKTLIIEHKKNNLCQTTTKQFHNQVILKK